jgi:hypothetical protein
MRSSCGVLSHIRLPYSIPLPYLDSSLPAKMSASTNDFIPQTPPSSPTGHKITPAKVTLRMSPNNKLETCKGTHAAGILPSSVARRNALLGPHSDCRPGL